ncbi:MAG: hypothetical protein KIT84_37285 [Labilithrix sp.]|nr:hypothetical protein [Labilithrix sp.]MCW5816713.1 hypothetical protein [Labilithrix sp.]
MIRVGTFAICTGCAIAIGGCLTIENNNLPAPATVPDAGTPETPETNNPADAGPEASTQGPLRRTGTYYATCLTELDRSDVDKAFSFLATTSFTRNTAGGDIEITLEALALVDGKPPTSSARSGIVGAPTPKFTGTTNAEGSFVATLADGQKATFPGAANPISGSDVELITGNGVQVGLSGRYVEEKFCARLTGRINQPAAARRNLDPEQNFCIFSRIAEGDPAPTVTREELTPANCPL